MVLLERSFSMVQEAREGIPPIRGYYICNVFHGRSSYVRNPVNVMKNTAALFLLPILFLLGCGSASEHVENTLPASVVRTVQDVVISAGEPTTIADISIDGMSCEMMCGGSIKKALAKLPGITSTEIDFVEGDEADHAIVSYDSGKVTDAQMVEAIQSLHDGQYKVLAVAITRQVRGNGTAKENGPDGNEEREVKAYLPSEAILPSIAALLTWVFRH